MSVMVIGGTGLSHIDGVTWRQLPLEENRFGAPSARFRLSEKGLGDSPVYFLPRHGDDGQIAPHRINYRANMYAAKLQGVKTVIAVNTVGGIADRLAPETLVVPDQVIDYTSGREGSIYDGSDNPLQHIDFTEPFSSPLRTVLFRAGENAGFDILDGGVYGCCQGPRLETAAEIRRLKRDGCDMVGMTAMPEAALAREMGMEYASLCLVVNWAAGITNQPISMSEIRAVVERGGDAIQKILKAVFSS